MIVEIIFTDLVPVPGHPNAVRADRFATEEGWIIERNGDDVILARVAKEPDWHGVDPFTVHGFKYALREAVETVPVVPPATETRRRRT